MNLPSAEFIPDAVLERRALALLREHEERTRKPLSLPIPIEFIIEKTLRLRIVWVEMDDTDADPILAQVKPDFLGEPTILLNERHRDHFETFFGTEQYSLAHEVAHWILHLDRGCSSQLPLAGLGLDANDADEVVFCRRMNDHDRREVQAERFAAFLLLPEHLLRTRLIGLDLSRPSTIKQLARDCHVSRRAMQIRLESLGAIIVGPHGEIAVPGHCTFSGRL